METEIENINSNVTENLNEHMNENQDFMNGLQTTDKWSEIFRWAFLLNYVDNNCPEKRETEKGYICKHIRASLTSVLESLSILLTDDSEQIHQHYIALKNLMDEMALKML
jgi:hypothetical protein